MFKNINLKTFCSFNIQKLAPEIKTKWNQMLSQTSEQYLQQNKLSQDQIQQIDLVIDSIINLTKKEQRYLTEINRQSLEQKVSYSYQHTFFPNIPDGVDPVKSFLFQQEELAGLYPQGFHSFLKQIKGFLSYLDSNIASGTGAPVAQSKQQVEEVKEEVKEEQLAWDVELIKIDATSKIKIIKEVRNLFGLGLKEAKDAVEKLPNKLKSGIKKEEAEELQKTLVALGCEVNLV